jgi:hypothetical protein
MCQDCLTPKLLQQILVQVTRKPIVGDNPYQQFMNVYRQNLFQAADETVSCVRRRRAFCTLQQLNQAMDVLVRGGKASCTKACTVPVPSTTIPSRDEPSLVSFEEVDPYKLNTTTDNKDSDAIPQSVTMMTTTPLPSNFQKAPRRVSLPEVVDCCDEGIL